MSIPYANGDIVTKRRAKAEEVPLMMLTNERSQHKAQMMLMLYQAAGMAQLGYMDGMDPETGEVHALLVGLEPTENGQFKVFPLARLLNKLDEIPKYLVPDGNGNYVDYSVTEYLEDSPKEEGSAEPSLASIDGDGGTLGGDAQPTVH